MILISQLLTRSVRIAFRFAVVTPKSRKPTASLSPTRKNLSLFVWCIPNGAICFFACAKSTLRAEALPMEQHKCKGVQPLASLTHGSSEQKRGNETAQKKPSAVGKNWASPTISGRSCNWPSKIFYVFFVTRSTIELHNSHSLRLNRTFNSLVKRETTSPSPDQDELLMYSEYVFLIVFVSFC